MKLPMCVCVYKFLAHTCFDLFITFRFNILFLSHKLAMTRLSALTNVQTLKMLHGAENIVHNKVYVHYTGHRTHDIWQTTHGK